MNEKEEQMLTDVEKAFRNNEVFVGMTGTGEDNSDVNFMTNIKNISLTNSLLAEALLSNLLKQIHLEEFINPSNDDVDEFVRTITNSVESIIHKHMRNLGKVSNTKPVNVVMADVNNHKAAVAINIDDPDKIKDDSFFQSMPPELQQFILEQARKVKDNHAK